jgi:hypothetical protein
MGTEIINPCARLTVGMLDCKHQIKSNKCPALTGECTGRANGIGADPVLAKKLVDEQKNLEQKRLDAVAALERYRSTERGLGHLSNKRALHSSPVPFK